SPGAGRGDGRGRGRRTARARGAAPRSRGARPRPARAGDDPQGRRRPPRGRDGDHAEHRVSARERTVKTQAIILAALWLPLAGRSECGVWNAECGVYRTSVLSLIFRTPHSAFRTLGSAASLTIGRLQYDGGGDWYANPSSLP